MIAKGVRAEAYLQAALDLIPAAPVAATTTSKIKTTPAWNEPGVRGGDALKRNKSTFAGLHGAVKGSPEWWTRYRSVTNLSNVQVCTLLAAAGKPAEGWVTA
jgi:hypothetical protein